MFIKKEVGTFDEVGHILPRYISNEVFNALKDKYQLYYTFETDSGKLNLNVNVFETPEKLPHFFLKINNS